MRNELCGAGRTRNRIYSDIDGCGRSKTRSKIVQVAGKTKPGVYFTRLSGHKGGYRVCTSYPFPIGRCGFRRFSEQPRCLFNGGAASLRLRTGHVPTSGGCLRYSGKRETVRTGGMRHVLWVINSGFPDHRPVRDRSARNCFARGIDPGKPGSCSSSVGRRCVRGGSLPATDSRPCAIRAAGPAAFPSL